MRLIKLFLLVLLIPQIVFSQSNLEPSDVFQFDGAGDIAEGSSNLGLSGDPAFTVIYSIFIESGAGSSWPCVFGTTNNASPRMSLGILIKNLKPYFFTWDGDYTADDALNYRQVYRIATTKASGNISTTTKLYVDGAEVSGSIVTSGANNPPNITDGIPQIGSCSQLNGVGKAWIWDVKVYDVELTAGEVLADYEGTHKSDNLIRWYKMDEGTGVTLADSSTNGDDATLANTAGGVGPGYWFNLEGLYSANSGGGGPAITQIIN